MAGMVAGRFQRELRFNRSEGLPGVEFVEVTIRGPAPPPVLLPQLVVVACDQGGGDFADGKRTVQVTAGDVAIRAPNQVSVSLRHAAAETRCRVVLIDAELLPPGENDQRRLARFGSMVTRAPRVLDSLNALWRAIELRGPVSEQQAQLASLIAAVHELTSTEAPRPPLLTPAVARTREALHQRFTEEVPLGDLARLAGMSKCHLVHLFHKEVGLPPHAYQIQLRVARARVLVAEGVPLAEVATMTGFSDQSHLTRLFKRVVGVPPGQYAALMGVNNGVRRLPRPEAPRLPPAEEAREPLEQLAHRS